jgi:glycine cleavage system T protein
LSTRPIEAIFFEMAKQSLLRDFHTSNGAVFFERDGWAMPSHFGSVEAEYAAVRSAAGLIDRCHRGLLQLTGPDRLSFLQGMLSNDLRTLKPGEGQHAAVLNQHGKVLGDVRVLQSENSFYLILWESIKDKIVDHLNRYLVADEVEIADRSAEYGILSIQGPQSKGLLQKLVGQAELPGRPTQHTVVDVGVAEICVVLDGDTGEVGFDLIIPVAALEDVAQRATDVGKQLSAMWVGEQALDILRIEAGIPRYGIDFTEDNLLLETGLDHAVSFTKGCYLGQEVIERIRSRGHVNRKLVGLFIDGRTAASPGAAICAAAKEVGSITSSVYSPSLGGLIALGYVHRDFWSAGTKLLVKHDNALIPAMVSDLPFLRGRSETASSS